jgi:protein-S-isoprenylcysteine O-methyltransferase Ste14
MVPGLSLLFWSLLLFVKEKTSPLPMVPTRKLVFSGPYRWTRNPMYLAMTLVYTGTTLLFELTWALFLLPLVLLALTALVVRKEERYLEEKFGEDYVAYKERVRRWL